MDEEKRLLLGYQESLAQLRQHPTIIWTRNNFFLLIQSGLLVYALDLEKQPNFRTRQMACLVGLFMALIWLWVNIAGRLLMSQWRGTVRYFEEKIFVIDEKTREGGGPFSRSTEGREFFVSVTYALIILSIGFVILWIILFARACS